MVSNDQSYQSLQQSLNVALNVYSKGPRAANNKLEKIPRAPDTQLPQPLNESLGPIRGQPNISTNMNILSPLAMLN
jgi:hypothetical protein